MNSTSAIVRWYSTCEYITARKAIVRTKRETVSLLGRFMPSRTNGGLRVALSSRSPFFVISLPPIANQQLTGATQRRRGDSSPKGHSLPLLEFGLDVFRLLFAGSGVIVWISGQLKQKEDDDDRTSQRKIGG